MAIKELDRLKLVLVKKRRRENDLRNGLEKIKQQFQSGVLIVVSLTWSIL